MNAKTQDKPTDAAAEPAGLRAEDVALALLANPHVERLTGLSPQQPSRATLEVFALNCERIASYFNEAKPAPSSKEKDHD